MMNPSMRTTLRLVFAACAVGGVLLAALEIWTLSNPASDTPRIAYSGYLFAVLLVVGLSALYLLRRDAVASTGVVHLGGVALTAVGVAGILYFLVFATALVCCGTDGIAFVNSYLLVVIAVGFIIGLLLAWKNLK